MSARGDARSSDEVRDFFEQRRSESADVDVLKGLVATGALPRGLEFRAVPAGGGQFTIQIANRITGGTLTLGTI